MAYQTPLAIHRWPARAPNASVETGAITGLICLTVICLAGLAFTSLDDSLWTYGVGCLQLVAIAICVRGQDMARVRLVLSLYSVFLLLVTLVSYHASAPPIAGFKPDLAESDGENYYLQALLLSHGGILDDFNLLHLNYFGYSVLLAVAFKYLTSDLIIGLLLNDFCLVLAIVALVNCTKLITRSVQAALFSGVAFMLTAIYVFYANVLLKDPLLILGVILVGYAFSMLKLKRRPSVLPYAMLAAAALIFGTLRLPMIMLIPAGLLLLGRDILRKGWLAIGLLLVLAAPAMVTFGQFTTYKFSDDLVSQEALKNSLLSQAFAGGVDASGLVGHLVGGYTDLPLLIRVVTLPIPLAIQYFLPFDFWSTDFLEKNAILFFSSNLNFLWYAFVGVFALFSVVNVFRIRPPTLRHMFILGAAAYAAMAFSFGGAVPRYGEPYLMLVFPAIGYWMAEWQRGGAMRIRLSRFFTMYYCVFFGAGLFYLAFQGLR